MESGHGPIVLFIGATLIVKLVKQTKAHYGLLKHTLGQETF